MPNFSSRTMTTADWASITHFTPDEFVLPIFGVPRDSKCGTVALPEPVQYFPLCTDGRSGSVSA